MPFSHSPASMQKQTVRLQKRIQGLQNEMAFIEILAQFWPWSTMARKVERLQAQVVHLSRQYDHYSRLQLV